jgi:hypothetical protein
MVRYLHEHILPLSVTPGRRTPKDLDSFLLPLIHELRQLRDGVPAYDAPEQSQFLLRAHLVLVTGDTPAISKIFHLLGHNAIYPCRIFWAEGYPLMIESSRQKTQYYYPLSVPTDRLPETRPWSGGNWVRWANADEIPVRTHQEYLDAGRASLTKTGHPSST